MSSSVASRRGNWAIVLMAVAIGGIVRLAAARGELWLDEVWSLTMVRGLQSVTEVFTRLRIDNNHHLNSVWLFLVPEGSALIAYRLWGVVCGTAALCTAAAMSAPRGRGPLLGAVLCCGSSYLLVHYSSEARGYAPLMLFVLSAWWTRQKARATGSARWNALYAVSCCLGFLSHIAFMQFFVPAAFLDVVGAVRSKRSSSEAVQRRGKGFGAILLRVGIPGVFFCLFWLISLRGMGIGGGNPAAYLEVILETLAISVGVPASEIGSLIGAAIAFCLIVGVTAHLWRIEPDEGLLFVGAAIVMPAVLLGLMGREDIYPRYFLVGIILFQWGLGDWLGSLIQSRGSGTRRIAGWICLVLFVSANGVRDAELIRLGRSHYLEMLEYVKSHSRSEPAFITADHPFRQGMMLSFYLPRSSAGEKVRMATQAGEVPEWILVHGQGPELDRQTTIDHPQLGHFELVRKYPAVKLSGWDLMLYQKR